MMARCGALRWTPRPVGGLAHERGRTMTALLIGYARCSTDQQDLTAQRERALVVAGDRAADPRGDLELLRLGDRSRALHGG